MGFDSKAFMSTHFVPREEDFQITAPELIKFFGEKDNHFFKLRGLTGYEIGRVNEKVDNMPLRLKMFEKLIAGRSEEQIKAFEKIAGISKETPTEIARRIEHLVISAIDPPADYQFATKLCEDFGIEFYAITNKILEISGKGHVPGKPKPSGGTKKSKPA